MERIPVETIIAIMGLAGAMIGGYVKLMTKIKELEIRLAQVEKQDDKILEKLESIAEDIGDIKIEMQNKVNR